MRKEWIKFLLKIGISLAILVILAREIDFGSAFGMLMRVCPTYYGAAVVLSFLVLFCNAYIPYTAMLLRGVAVRFRDILVIGLAVRFYSLFLPRALTMGIRWYRYQQKEKKAEAVALVAFERLIEMLTVTGIAAVFLSWEVRRQPLITDTMAASACLLFLVVVSLLSMFVSRRAMTVADFVYSRVSRLLPAGVAHRTDRLFAAVDSFSVVRGAQVASICAASLLSSLFAYTSVYIVALSLDLGLSFHAVAWMRSVVTLMLLVPVSVGGVGVRELGYAGCMSLYGVSGHEAVAFSLGLFTIQCAIGGVGGVAELVRFFSGVGRKDPKGYGNAMDRAEAPEDRMSA